MFVDRSSMCKHGAQGGQTGSAVTQINEATHEPVCTVPSQSRSQCSAASCGQNFGPCCRQSFCLSQEQLPSQTVQPYSGVLERCQKWCSAGRRPHADVWRRIWEWFRDIGEEAHVDSVTKCKAHLSKAEQAKLDETGHATAAGNEWADELAKEGEREDSFQTVLCDMYKAAVKTSRAIISYIGSFILQAKGGERWPDVVTPLEKWCAKDESVEARGPESGSRRTGWHARKGNGAAVRVAGMQAMVRRRQSWLALNAWGIQQRHCRSRQGPSVTSWLRRAGSCGAAGAEQGHPTSRRSLPSRAWGNRGLSSVCAKHTLAVEQLASQGKPFSWVAKAIHCASMGKDGGKATKGISATKLDWPSSSKQLIGSARQKRSQEIPLTRSTFS